MVGATLRAIVVLAVASICVYPAAGSAQAQQSVRLRATLNPKRLGHGTTLGFDIQIRAPRGKVPSPVVGIALRYPNDLGIGLSGLGLETCRQATLEAIGMRACPPDSLMGDGSATVEIQIGPEIVHETAKLAIVRAPVKNGRFALIFYADGTTPVEAQLSLPAFLLEAAHPFGGKVDIQLPLVPSLPESPDVALVHLHALIGPAHLTYYEHVHGRRVAYRPRGIQLPKSCPRGGFPFAATFAFSDGTRSTARTRVSCPR
ncbi:MAG TPA: hypothetical protein VFY36_05855 [Solirubrobacteraceae bacterium]|nr:hypothetical protein [Solirubrobacteraceae bacterium]